MGRRKRTDTTTPAPAPEPKVATDISLPLRESKKLPSAGVQGIYRPGVGGASPRRMRAFSAAEASDLFGVRAGKGGGDAFARWCASEKAMTGNERLSAAEWQPLLQEFANRPIHGHRRTRAGGNHRINKQHRR